ARHDPGRAARALHRRRGAAGRGGRGASPRPLRDARQPPAARALPAPLRADPQASRTPRRVRARGGGHSDRQHERGPRPARADGPGPRLDRPSVIIGGPMKLFIDTGSVAEVEEIAGWGILSGATTNPSLLAKEQGDPGDIIRRICDLVDGPTSAEVVSTDAAGMVEEGRVLNALHEYTIVKIPFSAEGLSATRALADE